MRRYAAFLLAAVWLHAPAHAQQLRVHPKVDTTVVHPRDHVVVPIVVAGDVAAVQMMLSYATTRLALDSIRSADSHWTVTSRDSAPGKSLWNAFAVPGATATVARAFFTAKSPLGLTTITPTLVVVGTMGGATVTNGYTTERVLLCVRASGATC